MKLLLHLIKSNKAVLYINNSSGDQHIQNIYKQDNRAFFLISSCYNLNNVHMKIIGKNTVHMNYRNCNWHSGSSVLI